MDLPLPSPIVVVASGTFEQDDTHGLITIVRIEDQLWRRVYTHGGMVEWQLYEVMEAVPPVRRQELEGLFFYWCVQNDVSPYLPSMPVFPG